MKYLDSKSDLMCTSPQRFRLNGSELLKAHMILSPRDIFVSSFILKSAAFPLNTIEMLLSLLATCGVLMHYTGACLKVFQITYYV